MFSDVRAVAVGVHDTDAAITFFTEQLGFEVRMDVPLSESMRWVEVAPSGSSTSVALLSSSGPPVGIDTGIRFVVDDAAATHAGLSAAGVRVDELILSDYAPPMFDFTDPDGNVYYASEVAG
ncbi:VOC family protein [Knoellia sp. CPCC 206453]|uniref:VOC family protein n=1 Tax=Knoellia pratensis TaxID=3404796 RepID=UPI00360D5930